MTDTARYNTVAMLLHWLMAFTIIGLIIVGFVMGDLPRGDPLKFQLYQLHKSTGLTILALAVIRILWRLAHRPPALPASMQPWERFAASATHLAFYVLMLAVPLTGWAIASTSSSGVPTMWFGLFEVPALPGLPDGDNIEEIHEAAEDAHDLLAKLTIALLLLHVGAALKHHFWNRDGVLKRMLPFVR
jgi:cytochrome b561